MADGGAKGLETENQIENHDAHTIGQCGTQQNYGQHQKSTLMAWCIEHPGRGRVVLSHLLANEIVPEEESWSSMDRSITQEEMRNILLAKLVTDVLESDGKPAIDVFVDLLSKMVYFLPYTKRVTAEKHSQIFI